MAEHFLGNRGFALETDPDAGGMSLVRASLTGGVPLLAPGILAVDAAVATATTFGTGAAETLGGGAQQDEVPVGSGLGATLER